MENLSHSFLKRSYGGNGFGTASHKSVYDDVFGGPPKFGMPTLAPRLEDYSEIFGGFHSARGSSIPILDLPVVDEAELYFDVRSSRFDYSEVFGSSRGLDFALSLDDFLRKSNGRDDPSDDAWSPAESESSLYDTDRSAFSDRSQSFANEDTHYPLSGIRQFDTSYNKANQRSNGKILNLDTPVAVAQLHAIPGVAYMIDENHVSQKVEGPTLQTPSELKSNMGFDGGTAADKKTISLPRIFDFGRHERDCSPVEKYSGSGFLQNKPFITVNDINLQTKPSRLPPPSRPPPVYDVEKGASAKLNSKMKDARSCTFEQTEDDSSPAFYDLEIDGSSSMTASTAMRDVMEKAQAKISSAKESIEKKEVLQTRLKLQPQSNTKTVEEKISNTVASISSRKDDRKVNCAEESSGTVPLTEERNKVIKMDEEVPDLVEQERFIDFVERTTKGRDGRETRLSHQVPLKSAQAFAWRQATEYFEVVDAGIPLKSVEQHKDETNLVHMGSDEFGNWVATEASDQKEEIKEFKAAKEAPELEEKNNKLEVAAEAWCDRIRSETVSDSNCEIVFQKIAKVGLNSCEPDMDKKKIKIDKQHEEIKKLQNDSNKSAETQTKADMNVAEVDDNPRGINEKPGSNKMLNDAYTRKTKERKPKETLVMQESDTRLNEAIEQEKDGSREIKLDEKKKQEEYHEKRKNKKKQKEVCERKENEDMLKEVIKHEYDGKRPRTATEHKQYEKNLKKSFEKEENKKSEELDGSATACVEEDIEVSSTVISTSRKGINVTEEASTHQELSGHPEDSGLIMRDGDDRTAKLNQVRYSTMERESIKAFDGTDKLNVESNSALSSEKLDKNFGKMETQATISCGEEEELKTELKESENGIDVRVGVLGDREIPLNTGKKSIRNVELKEKILNETIAQENNEIEERLQKERELEKEHLRKIEEEREREREREKDRMAVDRATLEARDRSRERATAELRQRAMAEAREKLEKSSLEARERSLADKASMEERIWAERAAVERATLEARQRAFEKAMADKVSLEGRARVERSVSDKFYTSSRTDEMRQSSSFLDLPGLQSQNTGTLNPLRYSYLSVHVGIESESPQRSKARLERYRRTAERADKALAEKNLRDLVAQREQAERNRLAETLDADVKRWSSGKEGNLRALLSTLQYILGPDSGWQPIPLTEVITSAAVKKAYRKATLCVHPDKLQQRGASIQQKYVCEKVFDLLKEAWNIFNSEEW